MSYIEAITDFFMKEPDNVVFVNRHRIGLFREDYMYRGGPGTRTPSEEIANLPFFPVELDPPMVRESGPAPEAQPWKGCVCSSNTAPTI